MNNNFKLKFNTKYFLAWLILVLAINYSVFIWGDTESKSAEWETTIETVVKWEIKKSIDVVWDAELVDEQSLTFNKIWTVTNVYFKEWETVKKWETIARLDDSDAYRSIEEAKLSLANAKISLNQLYEDVDESRIKQAENSILTSETNYNTSNSELENLKITQVNSLSKMNENIANLEKELEITKKEKTNSYNTKNSSKNTTIINIEDSFKDYLVDIETTIEKSDSILWVTIERKGDNDDYEDYLWIKDTVLKSKTKVHLIDSINLSTELNKKLETYEYSWDIDSIKDLLNDYLVLFNKLYETTDWLYKTIDNSITSAWSLSESDISSMKQSISWQRSTALSKIDSINSSIDRLNSLTDTSLELSNNELSIEKMELELVNLKKDLETTKTKYEIEYNSKIKSIESKKESLEIAKISLEELNEWPTANNIAKSQNSITQAELRLASAYEDLEDYMLVSPFDGVVRKIDYMPWDNLKDDNNKYVYIENPNLLEVSVMLDQIDIVNVENWDNAIVTFDAYTTIPVTAEISNIDTTPIKVSWVVSYEVKLILNDPEFDKKILSWMTADVEIISEYKADILLIKTSLIKTSGDKKIVLVENNWKQEQVEVETWLSSDWKTEIISWLSLWDRVIVWEFKIAWDDAQSSLFSTPWSGRWRPQ